MKNCIWMILCLPLLLFGDMTWEGNGPPGFQIKIDLSTAKLNLNETFTVTITATFPDGYSLSLEQLKTNLLQRTPLGEYPFKIVQEYVSEPQPVAQKIYQQHIQLILAPQMPGQFDISLLNIDFLSPAKPQQLFTPIFAITVDPGPVLPPNLMPARLLGFDNRLPVDLSPENRRFLENDTQSEIARNSRIFASRAIPWLSIAGICLFGAFLYYTRIKRPREETEEERKARLATEKEKALARLQTLPSDPRQFYTQLTDTVRNYIEVQYKINAPQLTTEEFLGRLPQSQVFDQEEQKLLTQFLVSADKVKFAKYSPKLEEQEQALQSAEKFIAKA